MWFSQWGEASPDNIDSWFGPELTATLVMLYAAQGCSAMNLYTPYVPSFGFVVALFNCVILQVWRHESRQHRRP